MQSTRSCDGGILQYRALSPLHYRTSLSRQNRTGGQSCSRRACGRSRNRYPTAVQDKKAFDVLRTGCNPRAEFKTVSIGLGPTKRDSESRTLFASSTSEKRSRAKSSKRVTYGAGCASAASNHSARPAEGFAVGRLVPVPPAGGHKTGRLVAKDGCKDENKGPLTQAGSRTVTDSPSKGDSEHGSFKMSVLQG
jgi:hypothetical protein